MVFKPQFIVDFLTSITDWWLTYPSEKYEFVNSDDFSIPNIYGKIIQPCSSHHQPPSVSSIWGCSTFLHLTHGFGLRGAAAQF